MTYLKPFDVGSQLRNQVDYAGGCGPYIYIYLLLAVMLITKAFDTWPIVLNVGCGLHKEPRVGIGSSVPCFACNCVAVIK